MSKYAYLSVALSLAIIALLPLHRYFVSALGNQDWVNMAFGLPIGLAMACNIEIVTHKIRRK